MNRDQLPPDAKQYRMVYRMGYRVKSMVSLLIVDNEMEAAGVVPALLSKCIQRDVADLNEDYGEPIHEVTIERLVGDTWQPFYLPA